MIPADRSSGVVNRPSRTVDHSRRVSVHGDKFRVVFSVPTSMFRAVAADLLWGVANTSEKEVFPPAAEGCTAASLFRVIVLAGLLKRCTFLTSVCSRQAGASLFALPLFVCAVFWLQICGNLCIRLMVVKASQY